MKKQFRKSFVLKKVIEPAEAELCQAQVKLGLAKLDLLSKRLSLSFMF